VGILAAFIVAGLTLRIPTTFLFAGISSLRGQLLRGIISDSRCASVWASNCFSALLLLLPMLPRLSAHYSLSTYGFAPCLLFLILPLIFLFVIGTANFYNFMDGINGIAGVSGAIAFGLMGVNVLQRSGADDLQTGLALLSICIALACSGLSALQPAARAGFHGGRGQHSPGIVFAALVVTLARNFRRWPAWRRCSFPSTRTNSLRWPSPSEPRNLAAGPTGATCT
jgi:Fuc2NAc and GlcNAc transferase